MHVFFLHYSQIKKASKLSLNMMIIFFMKSKNIPELSMILSGLFTFVLFLLILFARERPRSLGILHTPIFELTRLLGHSLANRIKSLE